MKTTLKKFNPSTLKPFDRVLGMCGNTWTCDLFSYYVESYIMPCVCVGDSYEIVIPYNEDTEFLVGSTMDPTEYYRYWD